MMWLSVAAVAVVGFLCWNLYRRFGADRIEAFTATRRPTSLLVSRGEFHDGSRTMEVALALTGSTFFYENADMQASIDLEFVHEIEYDTSLSTGIDVLAGKVLRLRCHSQAFEFVIPNDMAARWQTMLPARGMAEPVVHATPIVEPAVQGATP